MFEKDYIVKCISTVLDEYEADNCRGGMETHSHSSEGVFPSPLLSPWQIPFGSGNAVLQDRT